MNATTHPPYLKALREAGINDGVLDTAKGHLTREGAATLIDVLINLGVPAARLNDALARTTGATFTTRPPAIDPNALTLINATRAHELAVVPATFDPITRTSTVLVSDALDPDAEATLSDLTNTRVHLVQVPPATLKRLLFDHYPLNDAPRASAGDERERAGLLDEATARRHNVAPLRVEGRALVLVAPDSAPGTLADDLRLLLGRPVRLDRRPAHEVTNYLNALYGLQGESDATTTVAERDDIEYQARRDNVVIKTVNDVLLYARTNGASDVHIDPREDSVVVRIRKDGVLSDFMTLPKGREKPIVARVKVLAGLNIANSLTSQDGRIRLRELSLDADLRVATQPTTDGEKVTIRLLQEEALIPEIEDLGMSEDVFARFRELLNLPQGMVLASGPTGSGKSFTLFSFLKRVHTSETATLTIEDPVEYELAGVNQTQVNPKAGVTFASALRSFVRHDPDIILVGEIRDAETARLATEAAITGHLVLSTVHTNDAASTITRITEMGVPPYLLADALKASLAQRLLRHTCRACAEPDNPSDALLHDLALTRDELEGKQVLRGRGCDVCRGTGYDGRIPVHELLIVTPEIERAIFDRAGRQEIATIAQRQGTRSLRQNALAKAFAGITTLDEVLRRTAY
ncbi:MAG: GspE/PulE family protein [Planctomycetota bacterium]